MPDGNDSDNDNLLEAMNAPTPPSSPLPSIANLGKRTGSEAGLDDDEGGPDEPDADKDAQLAGASSDGPATNRNLASFAKRYATQKKLRGEQLTDVDNFVKVSLDLFLRHPTRSKVPYRMQWLCE
jgi:hypothetical protein